MNLRAGLCCAPWTICRRKAASTTTSCARGGSLCDCGSHTRARLQGDRSPREGVGADGGHEHRTRTASLIRCTAANYVLEFCPVVSDETDPYLFIMVEKSRTAGVAAGASEIQLNLIARSPCNYRQEPDPWTISLHPTVGAGGRRRASAQARCGAAEEGAFHRYDAALDKDLHWAVSWKSRRMRAQAALRCARHRGGREGRRLS